MTFAITGVIVRLVVSARDVTVAILMPPLFAFLANVVWLGHEGDI